MLLEQNSPDRFPKIEPCPFSRCTGICERYGTFLPLRLYSIFCVKSPDRQFRVRLTSHIKDRTSPSTSVNCEPRHNWQVIPCVAEKNQADSCEIKNDVNSQPL